jgi:hypothetical protein
MYGFYENNKKLFCKKCGLLISNQVGANKQKAILILRKGLVRILPVFSRTNGMQSIHRRLESKQKCVGEQRDLKIYDSVLIKKTAELPCLAAPLKTFVWNGLKSAGACD